MEPINLPFGFQRYNRLRWQWVGDAIQDADGGSQRGVPAPFRQTPARGGPGVLRLLRSEGPRVVPGLEAVHYRGTLHAGRPSQTRARAGATGRKGNEGVIRAPHG